MRRFAELLDRLSYTPGRNAKLKLMADYFAAAPDPGSEAGSPAKTLRWLATVRGEQAQTLPGLPRPGQPGTASLPQGR